MRAFLALTGMMLILSVASSCRQEMSELSPSFSIPLMSGGEITKQDLHGKVVVVDFWATWCVPCIMEIPYYNKLQRAYREKGLLVLGVAVESGPRSKVRDFAKESSIDYTIALGSGRHVMAFGGVEIIPTTFLLDKNSRIVKRYEGASSRKQERLEKDIKHLLDGRS